MVAVVIISVVIMAMIKMYADSINILDIFKKQNAVEGYTSFFINSKDYGYEKDSANLYRLVEDFDLDDDIRRELKSIKLDIEYDKLKVIDMSSVESSEGSSSVFEVGSTKLKTANEISLNIIRFRVE
jgi:hypothetical protein